MLPTVLGSDFIVWIIENVMKSDLVVLTCQLSGYQRMLYLFYVPNG
jgi:hypothetical protein